MSAGTSFTPSSPDRAVTIFGQSTNRLLLVLLLAATAYSAPAHDQNSAIQDLLAKTIARHGLPGMVAAISDDTGIRALGAAGTRKFGTDQGFAAGDRVHIGSCTKAMTAVMLATLVTEGKLAWETRLDAIPELGPRIHSDYRGVTLWELLTHRAGIPANAKNWRQFPGEAIRKQRLMLTEANLAKASGLARGQFLYSNLGYMIAGCMAEQVTGSSWEDLMQERVFGPLGMASAGFGAPGATGKTEEPWGHVESPGAWNATQTDNAEAHAPAGRVHCTVRDWAQFLALFLSSEPAIPGLNRLTDAAGNYGGGWAISQRAWAQGRTLTHSGSNTTWYATVWVAPALKRAFIVATNACNTHSHQICEGVINELIAINRSSGQ
jgi:CubicO group peptidase (beta-lactamase class C family)